MRVQCYLFFTSSIHGLGVSEIDYASHRVDFIRSIEYTDTFQRDDENDVLTPEEIRETEEMLKAEKDMRKAQGQQATDAARKADGDFRKPNSDASELAEQAEFAKQAELQIEKERFVSESTKLDSALTLEVTAPRPRTTASSLPSIPKPIGRAPSAISKLVEKNRDATPSSSAPSANRPSTLKTKPNPKYGHPSSSQPVLALPPALPPAPPPPPTTNKFKLDISKGLPSIFMAKGKDGTEKSNLDKIGDSSDAAGGSVKGVASVGTLKLKG